MDAHQVGKAWFLVNVGARAWGERHGEGELGRRG